MDAESIKSLVWILIWGGLFFFMMRYGCGAHIMGCHGRHGGHGKTDETAEGQAKDPVCGMTVDREKASAASAHRGKTYYFCSTTCRDKFEQEPEKYVGASAQAGHQQGGHHHG
jgi:YHS domain-containing protein